MSSGIKRILFFGLFMLPFIFWPFSSLVFEVPKIYFFSAWVSLLGILFIFNKDEQKALTQTSKILIYLLFSFFMLQLITAVIGVDWQRSLLGNYYRRDGLNTWFLLFVLTIIINFSWSERLGFYFAKVVTLSSSFVAIGSIIQALLFYVAKINLYVWNDNGFGSFFGQPVFLVGYLLVSLPFVLYLVYLNQSKKIYWLSLLIIFLALFLSNTWTVLFGLAILVWLTFLVLGKAELRTKILTTLGLLVILETLYTIYNYYLFSRATVPFIAESRPRIYTKIFLGYLRKPIFGWGWANIDQAFKAVDYPFKTEVDVYVDKAHSNFLEILTATGIFGLINYLLIIGYVFANLLKKVNHFSGKTKRFYQTLLISFIFVCIHMQTNIISIVEEVFFWFFVGIATFQKKLENII